MPLQMPLKAAAFYIALHIVLLIVLIALVIGQRRSNQIGIGDGGNTRLARWIRIHGNAVEQAAPNMAMLIMLALLAAPVWGIHLFGFLSLVARILHAIGMSQSAGSSFGRVAGMILTINTQILGALALLILAFL